MRRALALMSFALVSCSPAWAQNSILDMFGLGDEAEVETHASPTPPEVERAEPMVPLQEHAGDPLGIAGAWTITTERDELDCSLNGTAQISLTASGGYTCEIVMRDYCADLWDGIIRQSCMLSKTEETIHVDSTVLEALHGPLAGYSSDNFDLRLNDDGALVGQLRSGGRYPAIWRRVYDGIS